MVWVMVMGLWLNTKTTMLCKNRYVIRPFS